MTTDSTNRPLFSYSYPAPYGACDVCGAAGLPTYDTAHFERPHYHCAQHAAQESLNDAALQHLHALAWPIVSAWARYWQAAGLSEGALESDLELWGDHYHPDGALEREGLGEVIRAALAEGRAEPTG